LALNSPFYWNGGWKTGTAQANALREAPQVDNVAMMPTQRLAE
jgi:hypothetical protein